MKYFNYTGILKVTGYIGPTFVTQTEDSPYVLKGINYKDGNVSTLVSVCSFNEIPPRDLLPQHLDYSGS